MTLHKYQKDSLLEILHTANDIYGYLDKGLLLYISESLDLPPSHVFGVATFYSYFKFRKPGAHTVTFCIGTACFVKGIEDIIAAVKKEFNFEMGETSADGSLSLYTTRCIGACAMAPNVTIDDEVVGKATSDIVIKKIRSLIGDT